MQRRTAWDIDGEKMMNIRKLGILHPGEMGISVAVSAKNSANQVYWASEGRSAQTRARAEEFQLIDTGTLEALCDTCSVIISVDRKSVV